MTSLEVPVLGLVLTPDSEQTITVSSQSTADRTYELVVRLEAFGTVWVRSCSCPAKKSCKHISQVLQIIELADGCGRASLRPPGRSGPVEVVHHPTLEAARAWPRRNRRVPS